MMNYSREQVREARKKDLCEYLLRHHPQMFRREGNSLRPIDNPSISIREGTCCYIDFSTGEAGNSIDYLKNHLKYTFHEAVNALLSDSVNHASSSLCAIEKSCNALPKEKPMILPVPYAGKPKRIIEYLEYRGIPAWLCEMLFQKGLLYLEDGTNNLVFISKKKDFCELRGTVPDIPFHRCMKAFPDRFWAFRSGDGRPLHAMVCEGAIDAMSLFLLRKSRNEDDSKTLYCGIGGVYNQKAIERIRSFLPVTIAVDNDPAGEACRNRNPSDPFLLPVSKDWNEDLLAFQSENKERIIVS